MLRTSVVGVLASVVLFAVTGCGADDPVAGTAVTPSTPTATATGSSAVVDGVDFGFIAELGELSRDDLGDLGIDVDLAEPDVEQVFRGVVSKAFPGGYDADEVVDLGRRACTIIQERGGVDAADLNAMAEIAADLEHVAGDAYTETQYGFLVGLSTTTFCMDGPLA